MLPILAVGLLGGAALLLGPASTALARATWVDKTPRLGVAMWQALGACALLSGIEAGLCLAVARYHRGFAAGVVQLFGSITHGDPLSGLGLPDALGLTLAADLAVVLGVMFGTAVYRVVTTRAHHRHLVDLLALRTHDSGAAVIDLPVALAYCVPGLRPRIVVSEGTLNLLDAHEVDAVVAHERAHAHERHGMVMLPIVGINKVFTFIPYARLAPTAMAGLLEMAADDYAARHEDRAALVSALVSMATAGAPPQCSFGLAAHWVHRRVERLVHGGETPATRVLGASAAIVGLLALPLAVLLVPR